MTKIDTAAISPGDILVFRARVGTAVGDKIFVHPILSDGSECPEVFQANLSIITSHEPQFQVGETVRHRDYSGTVGEIIAVRRGIAFVDLKDLEPEALRFDVLVRVPPSGGQD